MFELPDTITISSISYPVRTDYRVILEIPPDSVFTRVLRIREKLRTGRKLEKYEKQWYRKNADLVHLKPKFSKAEEAILSEWA